MSHKNISITDSLQFPVQNNLLKLSFGAGAAGIIVSAVGYFVNADQFFFSYLTSFTFFVGLSLASLLLVMIHHITKSSWGTVIRRIPETFASDLWIWAIFFIPVILGIHNLFHWSHPELLDPASPAYDEIIAGKQGYLNTTFFIIRQVIYFAVWGYIGRKLYKASVELDKTGDWGITTLMRKISAPSIPIFAFTTAFASFDWLMSTDPHWFSTMFGVYFFAMNFQALFPLLILLVLAFQKYDILKNTISQVHIFDLGAWFFAFTIFYAYIAFSQYILIYYANMPEETLWFYYRMQGGYQYILLGTLLLRFALPFIVLLNRASKKNTSVLIFTSVTVLVMHYLELYMIIMPALNEGFSFSWLDLTTLIGIGGIFLGLFFKRFGQESMVPLNDPKMEECLSKTYHQ